MPASSRTPKSSDRLGGACRWTSGGRIRRARAMASRYSGSGQGGARCMAVPVLGQEVLDDDLLDVAVAPVRRRDRLEGVDPVRSGLADADQDAGGERDAQLTRGLQRGQPAPGCLVRGTPVAAQARVERLDHHPLRRRHGAQQGQLVGREGTGVGVGEQAGLVQHQAAHGGEVLHRRGVAVPGQPLGRHRVAVLGLLAQGEQRLVAAPAGTGTGDGQHLLRGQVGRVEPGRGLGEGAVAAAVAAQHGEGDEHLGGVGDPGAVGPVPHDPGRGRQLVGRQFEEVASVVHGGSWVGGGVRPCPDRDGWRCRWGRSRCRR